MVGKDQIYKTKIKPQEMVLNTWILGFVYLKYSLLCSSLSVFNSDGKYREDVHKFSDLGKERLSLKITLRYK